MNNIQTFGQGGINTDEPNANTALHISILELNSIAWAIKKAANAGINQH